ncbi:MAG: alpha/beta hydrolase [Caulobacterales bacterium]|nr:alpha/beta hydrolase [Caulobacterales bacterium]
MTETSGFLERPDGERLAWRRVAGQGPTILWVGGWRSDMGGTKSRALAEAALAQGWSYLRYDHFAHGASSGDWHAATIGRWREDLIALIDGIDGPIVLVGSSMGGWVAGLAAVARPRRVSALVLIAPAADFAHRLMWPNLSDQARHDIMQTGVHTVTDDFDGPYDLTRTFFDDARNWSLLDGPVAIQVPVRILQGQLDEPVPWRHALALAEGIESDDVVFSLIKDGDHRLSRPQDLERLIQVVGEARGL